VPSIPTVAMALDPTIVTGSSNALSAHAASLREADSKAIKTMAMNVQTLSGPRRLSGAVWLLE